MLERHFTLDCTQKGTDHQLSLTPLEFSKLIGHIRQLETILNVQPLSTHPSDAEILEVMTQIYPISYEDRVNIEIALQPQIARNLLPCERDCFEKLGKSLVYTSNLDKGHVITENDVCFKVSHPKGLLDEEYDRIIGARLCEDVSDEMPVQLHHLMVTTEVCNLILETFP